MSDTPRTDAKIPPPPKRQTAAFWRAEFHAMTGHACELERELQDCRNQKMRDMLTGKIPV